FAMPSDIVQLPICRDNGLLLPVNQSTSSAGTEYFINGTQPTAYCHWAIATPAPKSVSDNNQPPFISGRSEVQQLQNEIRREVRERLKEIKGLHTKHKF